MKTLKVKREYGTIETRQKRVLGITSEPLDYLLSKSLITELHHKAGTRYKWLYILRNGVPTIQGYHLRYLLEENSDDRNYYSEIDLEKRSKEFLDCTKHLKNMGLLDLVSDICIHMKCPAHLLEENLSIQALNDLKLLKNALEMLKNKFFTPKGRTKRRYDFISIARMNEN